MAIKQRRAGRPRKDEEVNKKKEVDDKLAKQYDVIHEPRCNVCSSPYRPNVDMLLARGFSYAEIERQCKHLAVTDGSSPIHYKSIQRHAQRHLDLEKGSYRAVMEKHAEELAAAAADGKIRQVTGKAWLDMFIQSAWDTLLAGELEIEAKDVIKAIELRDMFMKEGFDILEAEMMQQLHIIIEAIREIADEDTQQRILARVQQKAEENKAKKLLEIDTGTDDGEIYEDD